MNEAKPDFRKIARTAGRELQKLGYVLSADAIDLAAYAGEQQHIHGGGKEAICTAMERSFRDHSLRPWEASQTLLKLADGLAAEVVEHRSAQVIYG